MASPNQQFDMQGRQLAKQQTKYRAVIIALGMNFLLLAVLGIKLFRPDPALKKVEATSILLRDPNGRVIAEIGSEPGIGADKDLYRPFIKFHDRGNEPVMTLYGTGITFSQPNDQHATLDFLGLQVVSKRVQLFANQNLFSYWSPRGQLLVLPKSDGMNLTVSSFPNNGEEDSTFGVLTGPRDASMYVVSHKNEIDINADVQGTHLVRGKSR